MQNISIEMVGVIILSVILAGVLVAYDRVLKKLQRQHHEETNCMKRHSGGQKKCCRKPEIRLRKLYLKLK